MRHEDQEILLVIFVACKVAYLHTAVSRAACAVF